MSAQDFSGKVVLVTGATGGIGSACVRVFAARGATVVIHYHRQAGRAERLLESIGSGSHQLVAGDLGEASGIDDFARRVFEGVERVDVLVNNAGRFRHHSMPEVDHEEWTREWRATLGLNLMGPALLSFHVGRKMMEAGGGRIINVSSRGAFRGEPNAPAYGASKAGLNALSQSLARSLGPYGVFVYAVAPGYVETEMAKEFLEGPRGNEIRSQSPLGRVARPEEVAHTILFLASPGAEFLTGGIIDINGASYLRS